MVDTLKVHSEQGNVKILKFRDQVTDAYTQTYATADKTHANPTASSVATTGVTQSSPYGYAGATQGDAVATTINAIIVDLADLKQLVNSIIDDLQALELIT